MRLALFLSAILVAAGAVRADESATPEAVDFFQAMDDGLIEAKIVTFSSLDARVTVRNTSGKELRVTLPETFAAVHVYQFGDDFGMGGGGGGGGGGSRRGGGGGGQSSGGGLGGGGGGGGGGGFFNIAPERVFRKDVKTVCLEHGKREPRKHLNYRIQPLESVTDKPEVHVLCSMLATGLVDQQVTQAAVWHYNNGLSWEELAAKRYKARIDSRRTAPYFSRQTMAQAMQLGKTAEEKVAAQMKTKPAAGTTSYGEGQ